MLPSTGELFEARVSFPAILTGNQIVDLIVSYPILPFQWPFDVNISLWQVICLPRVGAGEDGWAHCDRISSFSGFGLLRSLSWQVWLNNWISCFTLVSYFLPLMCKYFSLTGWLFRLGPRLRFGSLPSHGQLNQLCYIFLMLITGKRKGFNHWFYVCIASPTPIIKLFTDLTRFYFISSAGATDMARPHDHFDCNWHFQPLTAANGSEGQ